MTQEALKMALDALETELSIDWGNQDEFNASAEKMYKATAAIKEALAQEQEPVCPECKAGVLYECVACSSNNYPSKPEPEPVAWRTFNGEGGYDYRSYEENESYADDWDKRNPKHKGWVEPLYTHPPQPEQEPVAWELGVVNGVVTRRPIAPPQRKPLTDDQIAEACGWKARDEYKPKPLPHELKIARAIEAAHGIKE
jgi:hypothetical protein